MPYHPKTPGEKIVCGYFGLLIGGAFIVGGICVVVSGHWGVQGHPGFITPQNDPWQYWSGVVTAFIAGAVAVVASILGIIKACDDDTPSS